MLLLSPYFSVKSITGNNSVQFNLFTIHYNTTHPEQLRPINVCCWFISRRFKLSIKHWFLPQWPHLKAAVPLRVLGGLTGWILSLFSVRLPFCSVFRWTLDVSSFTPVWFIGLTLYVYRSFGSGKYLCLLRWRSCHRTPRKDPVPRGSKFTIIWSREPEYPGGSFQLISASSNTTFSSTQPAVNHSAHFLYPSAELTHHTWKDAQSQQNVVFLE